MGVFEQVNLYILVAGLEALCAVRRKVQTVLFTVSQESRYCAGYPQSRFKLSPYEKSLFVLAGLPKLSVDFLAVLECGRLWTFSSVAAGAGTGRSFCCRCRCRSFCNFCCSASSTFSPFLSAIYRIGQRSILCCHEDKVR